MPENDEHSNDNPRVSTVKARQGDRSALNARVLIYSLGLLLVIGAGYAMWVWLIAERTP